MKCKGCQQEFENLSQLTKHKPECPGMDEVYFQQDEALLIPIDLCPEETKLYAQGQTVAIKVSGTLTLDGVKVQEVTLVR